MPQRTQEVFNWHQQYRDSSLELTYLRARYYQPKLKSFLTMDSYSLDNKYAFGNANPINFNDPSGHIPSWLNYALNGIALAVSIGLMAPEAATPFTWNLVTISGALGVASSITGITAQMLSDTKAKDASNVLNWVSFGLGIVSLSSDIIGFSTTKSVKPLFDLFKKMPTNVPTLVSGGGFIARRIELSYNTQFLENKQNTLILSRLALSD